MVVAPQEPWVMCLLLNVVGDGRGLCAFLHGDVNLRVCRGFRGAIPEFSAPTEILQTTLPLTLSASPFPFPAAGWRGELEAEAWRGELEAEKAEIAG